MQEFQNALHNAIASAIASKTDLTDIAVHLAGALVAVVNAGKPTPDESYYRLLASRACEAVDIKEEMPTVSELHTYLMDALHRQQHTFPQLNEVRGPVAIFQSLQCLQFAITGTPIVDPKFLNIMFAAFKNGVEDYENLRGDRGTEYLRRCSEHISRLIAEASTDRPSDGSGTAYRHPFPDPSNN